MLFAEPRSRVERWRTIGASRWVRSVISTGYRIKFETLPEPYQMKEIPIPAHLGDWVESEIVRSKEVGAWVEVAHKPRFCARAFVVTHSRTGKPRVVIDFSYLNKFISVDSFRYEVLGSLKWGTFQLDDWFLSFDLESGYMHVGMHVDSVEYLGFQFAGRYFYCTALPFGLSASPYVFSRVMRAVVARWRSMGIRLLPYLDDFLFLFKSREEACHFRNVIDDDLVALGLKRSEKKSVWEPTQRIDHLGFTLDSREGKFKVLESNVQLVRRQAAGLIAMCLRQGRWIPLQTLQQFAGKVVSLSLAVPDVLLHMGEMFSCFETRRRFRVKLSYDALRELRFWQYSDWDSAGGFISLPTAFSDGIYTDASDYGWGVVSGSGQFNGYFSLVERSETILVKEAVACLFGILSCTTEGGLWVKVDNAGLFWSLIKWKSRCREVRAILSRIYKHCRLFNIRLFVSWVPSECNFADAPSRFVDLTDYTLRRSVFEEVCARFGVRPTIDLFAARHNAQLPRFCSRHFDPFAVSQDGLRAISAWEIFWANPPWDLIEPMLHRIRSMRASGIVCLPYWVGARWFPLLAQSARGIIRWPAESGLFLRGWDQSPMPAPKWDLLFALM